MKLIKTSPRAEYAITEGDSAYWETEDHGFGFFGAQAFTSSWSIVGHSLEAKNFLRANGLFDAEFKTRHAAVAQSGAGARWNNRELRGRSKRAGPGGRSVRRLDQEEGPPAVKVLCQRRLGRD